MTYQLQRAPTSAVGIAPLLISSNRPGTCLSWPLSVLFLSLFAARKRVMPNVTGAAAVAQPEWLWYGQRSFLPSLHRLVLVPASKYIHGFAVALTW
jgi:hypothetical protein